MTSTAVGAEESLLLFFGKGGGGGGLKPPRSPVYICIGLFYLVLFFICHYLIERLFYNKLQVLIKEIEING